MVKDVKINSQRQEVGNKRVLGHIGGNYVQRKGKTPKSRPNNSALMSILSHLPIVHLNVH